MAKDRKVLSEMARYIDADKIDYTVTVVGEAENAGYRAVAFESDIDEMPTADAVEVVRCKDCAYRRVPTRCSLWIGTTDEKEHFREHGDNFYCAFGTLKERGGEK